MTWHEAIDSLEAKARSWTLQGVRVESQSWSEDPTVRVLVFARKDPRGERRVTLEPAAWKRDEVPTAADLYSAYGPRVRLQGPDAEGCWRFLTSDLVPLDVLGWNVEGFQHILDVLLRA